MPKKNVYTISVIPAKAGIHSAEGGAHCCQAIPSQRSYHSGLSVLLISKKFYYVVDCRVKSDNDIKDG